MKMVIEGDPTLEILRLRRAPHANSALVQQYDPHSVRFAHFLQLLNPTV